jgi:potassium efflux system protein
MIKCFRYTFTVYFRTATLFLVLASLLGPVNVKAQDKTAQPEKDESAQSKKVETAETKKSFPGINEIVPRATMVAGRIAMADDALLKAKVLDSVYEALDPLVLKIDELEARYTNWEDINRWQFSRLRNAESNYAELGAQQKGKLNIVSSQLQNLEKLRNTWRQQKTYWLEWQELLSKSDTKFPEETLQRTLASIEGILERINTVGGELLLAQQKYSPGQEIITRRLSMIDKAMSSKRRDTFRRNSFSLFESGFYRQFNRELFVELKSSLTDLRWPIDYFRDRGWLFALQVIVILIITMLLVHRKRQSKPIAEEWDFLFQRPLAGAIFITIILLANFTRQYLNMPLTWRWLLIVIVSVMAIRLINVFFLRPRDKKIATALVVTLIVNESLQTFGIPEPFLQLFDVLFFAGVIPFCLKLSRRGDEEKPLQRFLAHVFLGIAIIGLSTAMLGFESLATRLLFASISTVSFFIVLRIALHIISGGIETFMQLQWIRNRKFMQVLGLEAAKRKLQTLAKIIIMFNAFLAVMVIWNIFDNATDAFDTFLGYEYNFGESSLSVKMVLLIVLILYITVLISWVIQAFADSQIMTPKKMDRGIKESLKRLVHYTLFTFGFLVAVSVAGLDLQKFTILAGALGVGIGFGLQNIVNNFVSGLILLFERPVKVGDIININQDWGTISKIGLRSTVCQTFDNSEIIIPNADLIAQKVENWTFSSKIVRVVLPVGVEYGSPLEKVLEILHKAAKEHPEVIPDPEPNAIFEGFGTSSIDFQLRFWVKSIDDRLRIRTDVAVIVDRMFREENIVIAFPQLDLHLRSIDSDLQPLSGAKPSEFRTDEKETPEETD